VKRHGKNSSDEKFQIDLGNRIAMEIKRQGFESPYEFWINKAGDHLSRAALNYILTGKTDTKITTIRTIAKLLKVKTRDLLDFE
jgi:hypothetical protein